MVRKAPQGPVINGIQLSRYDGMCTIREAAALFGIHHTTFRRWMKMNDHFPKPRRYSKRTVLFVVSELLAWIEAPRVDIIEEPVLRASGYVRQMPTTSITSNKLEVNTDNFYYESSGELIKDCQFGIGLSQNLSLEQQERFLKLVDRGIDKNTVDEDLSRLQMKSNLRNSGKTNFLLTCLEREFKPVNQKQIATSSESEESDAVGALERIENEVRTKARQ